MIKKILTLLTVIALVVGLMPLQLNADQGPIQTPPTLNPPPRLELIPFYYLEDSDDEDTMGNEPIYVRPGDEFGVKMIIDQRLIDRGSLWNVNFDVVFPGDQMELIGINAHPYVTDPISGTPINYTGVPVPNDSGNLQFHFSADPYGEVGPYVVIPPIADLLGTLTFRMKVNADPGHYLIQPANTMAQDVYGQITDFQNYPAAVNIIDYDEVINIEIDQPVYGEAPQTYIQNTNHYIANIEWQEIANGTYEDPTWPFVTFKTNTAYAAIVFIEWHGATPINKLLVLINGEAPDSRSDTLDSGDIEVVKEFPPTAQFTNQNSGVNLSTLTPGFADSNPIDAYAFTTLPNALPFHYRWYRDGVLIPNSDNRKHTVVLADIGKSLKVEVYSDNYTGFITSQTTAVVTKGQQNVIPPVPAQLSATANSITILNKKSDQEYGISTSDTVPKTWGFADFNNLAANSDYYVFTRLAGTPGLFPGPAVSTHIKTTKLEQVISGPSSKAIHINASLDLDTLYQSNVVGANLDYSIRH